MIHIFCFLDLTTSSGSLCAQLCDGATEYMQPPISEPTSCGGGTLSVFNSSYELDTFG